MSSISSINVTNSVIQAVSQKTELSNETKMKLEALGINPENVTSESEAQSLIANASAAKQINYGSSNSSLCEIMTDAQKLAGKVGVATGTNDSIEDILANISTKVSALNFDGKDANTVKEYQAELSLISSRYDSVQASQQSLYSAMNMVSMSNKYALGL